MFRNTVTNFLRFNITYSLPQYSSPGIRFLYTAEALGLDGYTQSRTKISLQFTGDAMKEKFRLRMQEILKSESSNLIFTDDLKTMLNLAENTAEDINLLKNMIERFHSQSTGLRFGTFVFGPVIMRFFHMVNQPKEALSLVQNSQTVGLFDQFMTYQILMDMLLKNKMYNEVVDTFLLVQERNLQGNRFPKNCFILALAALYRMNTPESYEKMKILLKKAEEAGHVPLRRTLTYAAALAINQGDSKLALNIISGCSQSNYVTVRNLKALAFAKLGRLEDAFAILRSSLDVDRGTVNRKRTFAKDVIESISTMVLDLGSKETQLEFDRIKKMFEERNLVEDQTLAQLLDSPIQKVEQRERDTWSAGSFDRDVVKNSFNQRDRFQKNSSRPMFASRRQGLGDMD